MNRDTYYLVATALLMFAATLIGMSLPGCATVVQEPPRINANPAALRDCPDRGFEKRRKASKH